MLQTLNHYKHDTHTRKYNREYSSETSQAQANPTQDPDGPKTLDLSLLQRLRLHENTTTTLLLRQPIQQQQQHLQQPLLLLLHTVLRKSTQPKTPRLSTTAVGTDCRLLPEPLETGPKTNKFLLFLIKKKTTVIDILINKMATLKPLGCQFDSYRWRVVVILFLKCDYFKATSNVFNNLLCYQFIYFKNACEKTNKTTIPKIQ